MEKVIATIVIIVLTLGLVTYAIVGQMGGFKETADTANSEVGNLSLFASDDSYVPLRDVLNTVERSKLLGYEVRVFYPKDGFPVILTTGETDELHMDINDYDLSEDVGNAAVFKKEVEYGNGGKIVSITFTLNSTNNEPNIQ